MVLLSEVCGILLGLVPLLVIGKWHVGYVLRNDIRFLFMSAAVPPMLVWVSFFLNAMRSICALPLSVVVDEERLVNQPLVPYIPSLVWESYCQRVARGPFAYLL